MKACLVLFLLCFTTFSAVVAQAPAAAPQQEKPIPATLITVDYAFTVPAADMAKRFGLHSMVGGSILRKNAANVLFGVEGHFLFGNRINEDSLAINLLNSEGYITGTDGLPADVNFFLRGFRLQVKAGKLFAIGANPNSGIFVTGGAGVLQHKIHIEDRTKSVPQITGKYRQGYDRLSNGPALSQTIGFINLDKNRRVNFFAALEFTQAFTKNRRALNFDTRIAETGTRLDLLFALRAGWILPLYAHSDNRFYTH
ncbi:hypothetical protein C7N43_01535 [Sphingobacteriales bacterium UPWRP_1]|nr:hypothetical protein BVG80_10505 [Sphingobacteriales bacterium TSM_CSM]PSJ78848.1 hypothetical protein C7N43_01535 [Sphingobacteriales bacterium UPWRP_1]